MRMTLVPPAQAEAHLRHVTQQFAQWRRHRPTPRGYRIPDPLWAEAVRLAQVLPLTRVAKQLGLKPAALKRRRAALGTMGGAPVPPAAPQFVEVPASAWHLAPVEVEVQRPDGVRLRISYRDPAPVLTLLQTLLEAR
jgi:hypothetical protein